MSKGSKIVGLRIPPLTLALIDEYIASANESRKLMPYNRTSWIMDAVRLKFEHLRRGRSRGRRHDVKHPPAPPAEQG